jgi:hypothetical protein
MARKYMTSFSCPLTTGSLVEEQEKNGFPATRTAASRVRFPYRNIRCAAACISKDCYKRMKTSGKVEQISVEIK